MLCTVGSPERVIAEIARVLKPGGRYLFLEHVRAANGSLLGRLQDVVEPVHVYLAAGCHPNRRTAELLRELGAGTRAARARHDADVVAVGAAGDPRLGPQTATAQNT